MSRRRRALLRHARGEGFGALAAFEPENVFYMTGFWGEAAALLGEGGPVIVAPGLEAGRARSESDCDVVEAGRGQGVAAALAREARGLRVCTDCRDWATMSSLRRRAPGIRHAPGPFYACRAVKDASEARVISRASRLIDGLFEECARLMRAGQRETELQALLVARAAGEGLFDTGYRHTLSPLIVAGGPNGALPHAQPTGRRFRRGDLVVVDITLRHRGYVSDATRTFAVGAPPRRAADAYGAVREAQALGLRAARAGARCSSVDAACRRRIGEAGLGALFTHSTGHGIGLEVHEPPAVSAGSDARLREGMAITVEPGVYEGGAFGVRIEDSAIVRGGARPLHRFTRELVRV